VVQDVIEINGKRYDAITGKSLGKSHVIPRHIVESYVQGKVIDGFVKPAPMPKTPAQPKPAEAVKPAQSSPEKPATARHHLTAGHARPHQPQRSKTLMRKITPKPEFSLKPAIKLQGPAEVAARPKSALMRKPSAYGVDPGRHERALAAGRHREVRHFSSHHGAPAIHAVSSGVPVIAVRPMPLNVAATTPTHRPAHHNDMFEKAIASASSHLEPKPKVRAHRSKRRRLLNSLAIVGAFLVIGGFISYLNLPQIEMRVASVQAGFSASLPGYTPEGYALSGVKHSGGTISLSFRAGDSSYTLTQQSSNWNSQTLLDSTLALNGNHQTVQKNGQTIYIYEGGTNASWVNGGVRYDLAGNAELSRDDIASIATSL
jgi:hypothetical protein